MAIEHKDSETIQQYKDELQTDYEHVKVQSDLADEDMRFINVDGGQWEDYGSSSNDDRVKLEVDIVSDYVYRFVGEWNQNRVGVEFKPEDGSTDEDAELLNGIYRADYRQNSGKMSVDNAVDETATVGYGCFKLVAFFEDEGDPENDKQRIKWEPINNAYDTVIWDSAAKRIDKRDATRCTELVPFTKKSFAENWPNAKPVSAFKPDDRFNSDIGTNATDVVYVAVRYEIVEKKETFHIFNNMQTDKVESYSDKEYEEKKDEISKDELRKFVRVRKVKVKTVEKVVFSGEEILEKPVRIAGKYIPIIAMYGYHAFVDNSERYRGLVRKLKDPAKLFNSQVSQLAENSGSSGQEVPIFTEDQIEGHEDDWADRNNKPYLLLNPMRDDDGNIVATSPTSYVKPPQLDGSTAALLQIVPNYVQQVTGKVPEETKNPDASGKAIRESRKIENLNTQPVTDNIFNAIEWSGVVYEAMASDGIYTTQRMVNTLSKDGTESPEMLLKSEFDSETGRQKLVNNLNGKKFRAYADIGPQYDTLREQTVEDVKGALDLVSQIPNAQEYLNPMLAVMFENMNGVGLGPLKEMNRKQMILQGLVKPKTDEEKKMLAEQQAAAQQPDSQQELVAAAANQANAEARERESKVLDNAAAANKKTAETQQILSEMAISEETAKVNNIKTLADIRRAVFEGAQTGTLQ